jgi:hypothetical protein
MISLFGTLARNLCTNCNLRSVNDQLVPLRPCIRFLHELPSAPQVPAELSPLCERSRKAEKGDPPGSIFECYLSVCALQTIIQHKGSSLRQDAHNVNISPSSISLRSSTTTPASALSGTSVMLQRIVVRTRQIMNGISIFLRIVQHLVANRQ